MQHAKLGITVDNQDCGILEVVEVIKKL